MYGSILIVRFCTISTHDMATLRGWWEEDYEQTCRYYNQVLGHWGEVPTAAPGWVCEEIVRNHLECPSLLCILSFQDWLSMDEEIRYPNVDAERINVPGQPAPLLEIQNASHSGRVDEEQQV